MLELFTNPGYLAAGGTLVSAPIIIHLINRMRFKRLRWAAMEFLLKSQKRNRRRLIIEQLILLMLRCLLVVLTTMLVARFVGFSFASFSGKDTLHVVLVDDTLSMTDRWKEGGKDRTAFQVGVEDVIFSSIYKSVSQSTTNERLAVIPLSQLKTAGYQPKLYSKLGQSATQQELKADLDKLQPTFLHADLTDGVKLAAGLLSQHTDKRHVVHIVSDFRQRDWTDNKALREEIKKLALREEKLKVRLIDTVYPYRVKGQGGIPVAHDNLGIVDFRPNTRVVAKGAPVKFTVTIANYSPREEQVNVQIYDESGKEQAQLNFDPPLPLKVPANGEAKVMFEERFYPDIRPDQKYYALRLLAELQSPQRTALANDGLLADNQRYAAVEVRNKVPILVVDGEGVRGRNENEDSFFIENAILSVPGSNYEVVYADQLVGGAAPAKVLELPDLQQYPCIFMLNVPELTPEQRKSLEGYVNEGGGVAFFLGPRVSGNYYTTELYRDGTGVFPVPLRDGYYPASTAPELKRESNEQYQLRLRDDQYADAKLFPIFGAVFNFEPRKRELLEPLKDLPIHRYFQVPRSSWRLNPGRTFELATLPNEATAQTFEPTVMALRAKLPVDAYPQYKVALERHLNALVAVLSDREAAKAHVLAQAIDNMLYDSGRKDDKTGQYPDLTELWGQPDPKIRAFKEEALQIREATLYGDPLVVAQLYGMGKVTAVMTTAGKKWNKWAGGSIGSVIYPGFVWETLNWLSSQGAEANLTVGTEIKIDVAPTRFQRDGKPATLKMVSSLYKLAPLRDLKIEKESPNFGVTEPDAAKAKKLKSFLFPNTRTPGYYQTDLYYQDSDPLAPHLAGWGHIRNVDTPREGRLQRVSQEDMDQLLLREAGEAVEFIGASTGQTADIINRQTDLSESVWFFLVFLMVLIGEQALAVHLSFHMRSGESQLPAAVSPQAGATPAPASAA